MSMTKCRPVIELCILMCIGLLLTAVASWPMRRLTLVICMHYQWGCMQAESLWLHLGIIKELAAMCHSVFQEGDVQYGYTTVPTYPRWVDGGRAWGVWGGGGGGGQKPPYQCQGGISHILLTTVLHPYLLTYGHRRRCSSDSRTDAMLAETPSHLRSVIA